MDDLVSHGASSTDECWGTYGESAGAITAYGPGYANSCIHSGINEYAGGDTVWYNYAVASAGTIIDENTTQENPASNTIPATESICPKGWTLPNSTQINGNRDTTIFSPVLGGVYYNSILSNEDLRGLWWGDEASNSARRYSLRYTNNNLYTDYYSRHAGMYVRCVVKKNTKTLSNLTYMQDMTPAIGSGREIRLCNL